MLLFRGKNRRDFSRRFLPVPHGSKIRALFQKFRNQRVVARQRSQHQLIDAVSVFNKLRAGQFGRQLIRNVKGEGEHVALHIADAALHIVTRSGGRGRDLSVMLGLFACKLLRGQSGAATETP